MIKLIQANNSSDIDNLFGKITPPEGMRIGGDNPLLGLSSLISFGIRIFLVIAGLFLLLYLLLGAFDWITSGGEKEKITKAQNKITNALIGIILVFAVLVIFNVVAGNLLGIIKVNPDGSWTFDLPTLR